MHWKRWGTFAAVCCIACSAASAQEVRIGVLGIFHPQELTVNAVLGESMVITANGTAYAVQRDSNAGIVRMRIHGNLVVAEFGGRSIEAGELRAAGSNNGAGNFVISIPGKIKREYRGTLEVKAVNGVLVAIVSMELETAVASVVQAESEANTPMEALKAQAIVTRSYFLAGGGRHADFDFCDLTHCQFLREPAEAGSAAEIAASATRGLIVAYEEKPVTAMFTRSCGGETRTPESIGMPIRGYPYFSVRCDACYKNPVRWTRRVSPPDAALLFAKGEAGRLAIDRRLGWSAVPSNNFTAHKVNDEVVLHGRGEGHGVGLCQRGARAMAAGGADFRTIVLHYFPNATIASAGEGTQHRSDRTNP